VPCGVAGKLPVGLQLIAPAFEEERLLRLAHFHEMAK
jgi:Asp-tRNA(Asn)/Glu-tRNA(Gln) amidotransferase A subunit family amidase